MIFILDLPITVRLVGSSIARGPSAVDDSVAENVFLDAMGRSPTLTIRRVVFAARFLSIVNKKKLVLNKKKRLS
jgi:hypothetical protein